MLAGFAATFSFTTEETIRESQACLPPPHTHSAVPVMCSFAYLVVGVLPNANLGVCSRLLPWQCALHVHTPAKHPTHTCKTFSLPDNLGTMPFAAAVSCLILEPSS